MKYWNEVNQMPKTALEKQIEKQMRQAKQLADRQHRDEQRQARETRNAIRKQSIRDTAYSVVNGQPIIEGLRVMDATAEDTLRILLGCERSDDNRIEFCDDIFPAYIQASLETELEKLKNYGMINGLEMYISSNHLILLPQALSYFDSKEQAIALQKKHEEEKAQNIINNYGNLVYGDVSNSTLSVDNSVQKIKQLIDENGGDDKEVLHDLLEEVKELISNIEASRTIPKQKRLFQRISDHMEKHDWFYGAVVQLLGTAALTMLGQS